MDNTVTLLPKREVADDGAESPTVNIKNEDEITLKILVELIVIMANESSNLNHFLFLIRILSYPRGSGQVCLSGAKPAIPNIYSMQK